MNKLLTQNRRNRRAGVLVRQWAAHGVSVSPIAHDRYSLLLDRLRAGRSWPLKWTDDFRTELLTFVSGSDLLTILGWDVDEEPALLVSANSLSATLSSLDHIYPDGFVLISDVAGKALLVDFDAQEGTHINMVDMPTAA